MNNNPFIAVWMGASGLICLTVTVYHIQTLRKNWPKPRRISTSDPIPAWKAAYMLMLTQDVYVFAALNGTQYAPVDEYVCVGKSKTHKKLPKLCTCGFYALNSPARVFNDHRMNGATWLLQVELYGTVHEGPFGYRAEKQRVLSVYGQCSMCSAPADGYVMNGSAVAGVCKLHGILGQTKGSLSDLSGKIKCEVLPLTAELRVGKFRIPVTEEKEEQ